MEQFASVLSKWARALAGAIILSTIIAPTIAKADEGGISFWVPGFFGSLAAAPLQPGLAFTAMYYHSTLQAGGAVAFARQVTAARLVARFSGNLSANLDASADLGFGIPSYTFKQTLLGGQPTLAIAVPYGRTQGSVNATLNGNFGLGGPGFSISRGRTDYIVGLGDLAPMFNLRWNLKKVHNVMTYISTNLSTGAYNAKRLANLGINHSSLDIGGGYTYFNPAKGDEFSAVLGVTYNFPNTRTRYQNGTNLHLDTSLSHFIKMKTQVGLVGYAYDQISCDSGSGNRLGCFRSRVFGFGPQLGYLVSGTHTTIFFNAKAFDEFGSRNRASGWNIWLTMSISPAPPPPPSTKEQTKKAFS